MSTNENDTVVDRSSDGDDAEGRFILLTGPGADEVAQALTRALPRAASVDGPTVGAMFGSSDAADLEQTFLRYTAGIALADSFRLAGYDAVVAEDVPEDHIEDYLDFAAPTTVHLIRLGAAEASTGVGLPEGEAEATAEKILARLDEAAVTPPADEND